MLREKPDAVIVATGGIPDTAWLDGAEHCTTVWDILSGAIAAKDEVIVYDGTGRHQAVSCALHLAEQDRDVQFVTLDDNMGLEMEYTPASSTGSASPSTACAPPSTTSSSASGRRATAWSRLPA